MFFYCKGIQMNCAGSAASHGVAVYGGFDQVRDPLTGGIAVNNIGGVYAQGGGKRSRRRGKKTSRRGKYSKRYALGGRKYRRRRRTQGGGGCGCAAAGGVGGPLLPITA